MQQEIMDRLKVIRNKLDQQGLHTQVWVIDAAIDEIDRLKKEVDRLETRLNGLQKPSSSPMVSIDLKTLTKPGSRVLIGHENGVAARQHFQLDYLDSGREVVTVVVPQELRSLTPSFVQGMFAGSVHKLGPTEFFRRYKFEAPKYIIEDIRSGVDRALADRAGSV